jgi:hypothetical protein
LILDFDGVSLRLWTSATVHCSSPDDLHWYGERRWNNTDRENRRTLRKTCHNATLSTANPTWIDPGANPGLHGESQAANRLSRCTALTIDYWDFRFWRRLSCCCRSLGFCRRVYLQVVADVSAKHAVSIFRGWRWREHVSPKSRHRPANTLRKNPRFLQQFITAS